MSIESMQSTYRAYQEAGGMDKYLKQEIDAEQKERILQLLFEWCNEVNRYYFTPKNESVFQNLKARCRELTASVFIFGKATSEINLTEIQNPTKDDWIEACILIKDIAENIFSYLNYLESIILQKDHPQIAQFLDNTPYIHALKSLAVVLDLKKQLEEKSKLPGHTAYCPVSSWIHLYFYTTN